MRSEIYPNAELNGVPGFYVGKVFVPMTPHRGHVGLVPTKTGKGCGYRLAKNAKPSEGAMFTSTYNRLALRSIEEPRTENELQQIAASEGVRLVVLDEKGNV